MPGEGCEPRRNAAPIMMMGPASDCFRARDPTGASIGWSRMRELAVWIARAMRNTSGSAVYSAVTRPCRTCAGPGIATAVQFGRYSLLVAVLFEAKEMSEEQ